jgi:hypothetical protein
VVVAPGQLELAHVVARDLRQGRVARAARIRAVDRPLGHRSGVVDRSRRCTRRAGERGDECDVRASASILQRRAPPVVAAAM